MAETCPICRNILSEPCILCEVEAQGKKCPSFDLLKCDHKYHYHCILRWWQGKERREEAISCPMCQDDEPEN